MHMFTRELTFTPLSKNRYRCNQTGKVMTQRQILGYISNQLNTGRTEVMKVGSGKSSKKGKASGKKKASKYAQKRR